MTVERIFSSLMSLLVLAIILPCIFATCQITGPQCRDDCKGIVLCPAAGSQEINITRCPDNMYCSDDGNGTLACDAYYCGEPAFICTAPGALPNPFDCTTYYLCPGIGINVSGILQQCPNGSIFDPELLDCSFASTLTCITTPSCSEPAEQGKYDDNGVFCYICDDRRLPIVFPCSLDEFYENNQSEEAEEKDVV